jgi:stearoyl-CoA desaturase (delta-9 desaturase)
MSEQLALTLKRWFDTSAGQSESDQARADRIDRLRAAPFIAPHIACVAVL